MRSGSVQRRLPIGAEAIPGGGVHFRVWAPIRKRVEIVLEKPDSTRHAEERSYPLQTEGNGYFSGLVQDAGPGSLYSFRLDGEKKYPDPASRFQPQGPHGPSQVIDPNKFEWTDGGFPGVQLP